MNNESILIVEDERIIAFDLQRRLDKFGFNVIGISNNFTDAVTQIETKQPTLVLMDIMLGEDDKDGIDAAIEIKERFDISCIFLTAYADESTLERAKNAQPFGYILKPFKEKELLSTVEIALFKISMDKQLKSSQKWLSTIISSVGDGIIAVDSQNNIRLINKAAETSMGYSETEVVGKKLIDVFNPIHQQTGQSISSILLNDASELTDLYFFDNTVIQTKNKESAFIEGTISRLSIDDQEHEGYVIAFRDITDVRNLSATLSYQESHDNLTGLLNRREIFYKLKTFSDNKTSYEHIFLYLDLDQFKVVNDVCGHVAGDELIKQVGVILDTGVDEKHSIGRLGGDEFGIILESTSLEKAEEIAQELLNELKLKYMWEDHSFNVTVSIGIVPMSDILSDAYSIMAAADDACYIAKEEGGNRIQVYSTSDETFTRRRGEMRWISKLNDALEEDRFILFYQPIAPLDKSKNQFGKNEILLRLIDSEGNLISPQDFIPAAERYNLMPLIDRYVIKKVFEYLSETHEKNNLEEGLVAINLSASSLLDHEFLAYILEQFDNFDVSPYKICFEITETTAIENLSLALNFIKKLKNLGCTFSLDDFGNGFTSFAYLKNLPVDYLKIDGSYVKNIHNDKLDFAMVEAINKIGHTMGMKTIAEYVANTEIESMLKAIHVDFVQGYAISPPKPLKL